MIENTQRQIFTIIDVIDKDLLQWHQVEIVDIGHFRMQKQIEGVQGDANIFPVNLFNDLPALLEAADAPARITDRFESQLDAAEEIAMGFAGDATGVLRIEGIGYFEPDIITFYGIDDNGARTQLIQHVSQLSVTLRAVPKSDTEEPPRRIGFQLTSGWTGGESGDASA